jgi:hypothetical protein
MSIRSLLPVLWPAGRLFHHRHHRWRRNSPEKLSAFGHITTDFAIRAQCVSRSCYRYD